MQFHHCENLKFYTLKLRCYLSVEITNSQINNGENFISVWIVRPEDIEPTQVKYTFIKDDIVFNLLIELWFVLYINSGPYWATVSPYWGFTITLRHATLGRTPLDERSAPRSVLYMTKHNILRRQTSMPPTGFEPIMPAAERPQTHALDRAATGIGSPYILLL